jgi:hypothetical protein
MDKSRKTYSAVFMYRRNVQLFLNLCVFAITPFYVEREMYVTSIRPVNGPSNIFFHSQLIIFVSPLEV